MWELHYKETECWRTDAFELWCWRKLLRVLDSQDCKGIKPVNPEGNQSWIFTRRTDAEVLILWPPDAKNQLNWKDPDGEKVWRWEEKGPTEDKMVGWHHRHNGHEFEALGVGDGQGNLVCCSPWVTKGQILLSNWTKLILYCITNQKPSLIVYSNTNFHIWL